MGTDGIRKKNIKPIDLRQLKKSSEEPAALVERASRQKRGSPEAAPNEAGREEIPFIEKWEKEEEQKESGILITEGQETTEDADSREDATGETGSKKYWWSAGAGGLAILAVFILVSTVFSRLTVNLKLKHDTVALQEVSAAFDTSVSKLLVPQRVIPAQKFELSGKAQGEFAATGKKHIEERARGKVKIYNAFSSSPQALVAATRFVSEGGVLYRLPRSITVPGAEVKEGKIVPSFIEVELAADRPGQEPNTGEGVNLKIPGFKGTAKYEGFYAQTSTALAGGYQGEATVVSANDLKAASEEVTKRAYQEIEQELLRKIPPDFTYVDRLREIEIVKVVAPGAEAKAERFTVETQVVARALVFRKSDVEELVQSLVIPPGEEKELAAGSLNVQYLVRNIDFAKGRAGVALAGEVKTKARISVKDLAALVRGKKEGSIIELLRSRQELSSFRVSFFPPWIFSAPKDHEKVKVIIDN